MKRALVVRRTSGSRRLRIRRKIFRTVAGRPTGAPAVGPAAPHLRRSPGRVPLVHVQNTAVPFQYSGGSDVEPLIPLQDELNTRLSDRANRITLQSFKMYLGKGVDNFDTLPVAPGRMWVTDNEKADVIEF